MTASRAADGSRVRLDLSVPWTYRVAQNPRFIWIPVSLFCCVMGYSSLLRATWGIDRESVFFFCLAAMFFSAGYLRLTIAGFTHLRAVSVPDGREKAIPSHGQWLINAPIVVLLLACSQMALNQYVEPSILNLTKEVSLGFLISGLVGLVTLIVLILARGHHRRLVFTPDSLEYSRAYFRASIPWSAIVAMRPVGNAHRKSGGDAWIDTPSQHNLAAGMQVAVSDEIHTRGRRKKQRINGREVIGIDCSGFEIDPNTLINAIHLLWSHPELRANLDTPAGTQLFTGPSWNTRRRMRVGDRWDRATDQIIKASDGTAP